VAPLSTLYVEGVTVDDADVRRRCDRDSLRLSY